jgi:hypothetical protein
VVAVARLRVISGPAAGTVYDVPVGVRVLGRDPAGDLYVPDPQVSWRHARIERTGDRTVVTDLRSTNGTTVNGRLLRGPHELQPGDLVDFGRVRMVYDAAGGPGWPPQAAPGPGGDPGAAPQPPYPGAAPQPPYPGAAPRPTPPRGTPHGEQPPGAAPRRADRRASVGRVRIGRVILLAGTVQLLGWLVTTGFTFVGDHTVGLPAWLLAPSAAIAAGIAQAVFEASTGPPRQPEPAAPPGVPAPRRRGIPVMAALVALLLVGTVGYGVTFGIRYAVGWVTGNEDPVGRDRLASPTPPSDTSGRVRVTVTGVVDTAHFTRVSLTIDNQEEQSATLNLYHNCLLTGGGVTLQADPFRSDLAETVAPGSTQRGTVLFAGHIPASADQAQFSILNVFVFGRFGADDSIVIRAIRLRAP